MRVNDDYENIQKCLTCTRKRCTNCLERVPARVVARSVQRIDPVTGAITASYPSYAEAGRQNSLYAERIRKAVKSGKLLDGYYWKVIVWG